MRSLDLHEHLLPQFKVFYVELEVFTHMTLPRPLSDTASLDSIYPEQPRSLPSHHKSRFAHSTASQPEKSASPFI
jgi:hypothetical protein